MILTFSWISQNWFYIGKSPGSGLWITRPQMALGSLLTHDHGAARPLRGSGGRRDSSERERERERRSSGSHQWHHLEAELQRWPHNIA
jgi:hypothetical protein